MAPLWAWLVCDYCHDNHELHPLAVPFLCITSLCFNGYIKMAPLGDTSKTKRGKPYMKKLNIKTKPSHASARHILYSTTGLLLLTIAIVTAISGTIITQSVHADSTATSNVSVTVNTACTLAGGSNGTTTGESTYTATINPGTSQEITGSRLTTICNDPNGYSIYAVGYSNDSYDTPTNTQMIGAGGIGNISTGTSGSNSYWAMKLSAVSGITAPTILNNFNNYHNIPEDYTQIAKYTAATTTSTSTGAAVQTNYKVSISSSQTAGTYTGKVKYTMVHPNDAVAPSTKLYMQDMTASDCTSVAQTVYDNRDGESYLVQRLADDKCWMLDNLRLDPTTAVLNTANTHMDGAVAVTYYDNNDWKINSYEDAGVVTAFKDNAVATSSGGSSKIGTYYNFCAASAGTRCTDDPIMEDAEYDLCPSGWRLPTGGQYGDYENLYMNYIPFGFEVLDALRFSFSGEYDWGQTNLGESGTYWTSNDDEGQMGGMYVFRYRTGDMDIDTATGQGVASRNYGCTIRCVMGV